MEIITSLEQLNNYQADRGCVIALGTFDGLHRGHQQVIAEAGKLAVQNSSRLGVFTFSNHPMEHINPARVPVALLTHEEKLELLESLGVELLIDLPFDEQLAKLRPDEFVKALLKLNCRAMAIGENFTYGYKGSGNADSLQEAAAKYDFSLKVCSLLEQDGEVISSTLIRKLLLQGEVARAGILLGRSYSLSGVVAHGNERGRLINFPTANLEISSLEKKMAIPAEGAYAVLVELPWEKSYFPAMANIGKNPTFGDVEHTRLEVHLLDFSGDLYDKNIKVLFVQRLRGQIKFTGLEQLQAQLEQDKALCRKIIK